MPRDKEEERNQETQHDGVRCKATAFHAGRFRASEIKIGSTPKGSTTTSRVANAVRPNFRVAPSIA